MASAVCPTNTEVTIEVERWKSISQDTLIPFKDKDTKMINEFAFMRAKVGAMAASNRSHSVHSVKCLSPDVQRKDFPLHYFVFRQTASHLLHEGG